MAINWQPGEEGKGVVDANDEVHAWNVDEYPLHQHFLADHPEVSPHSYFSIRPHGMIELHMPNRRYDNPAHCDAMEETICDADPHFRPEDTGTWDF